MENHKQSTAYYSTTDSPIQPEASIQPFSLYLCLVSFLAYLRVIKYLHVKFSFCETIRVPKHWDLVTCWKTCGGQPMAGIDFACSTSSKAGKFDFGETHTPNIPGNRPLITYP